MLKEAPVWSSNRVILKPLGEGLKRNKTIKRGDFPDTGQMFRVGSMAAV